VVLPHVAPASPRFFRGVGAADLQQLVPSPLTPYPAASMLSPDASGGRRPGRQRADGHHAGRLSAGVGRAGGLAARDPRRERAAPSHGPSGGAWAGAHGVEGLVEATPTRAEGAAGAGSRAGSRAVGHRIVSQLRPYEDL
jgi:hypothetical protein